MLHDITKDKSPIEQRANKLFMLGHSPEFIADMMGPEHQQKSELWQAYKEYIPNLKIDKAPENKYEASAQLYNAMEKDRNKKMEYGAKKIVEATRDAGEIIKPETVKSILGHLVPEDKKKDLEKNAGMIARAATETKKLPFKDRCLKIVDTCRVGLGMVSKDVAKLRADTRQEKKKGRDIKPGGFLEKLLKQRSEKGQSKDRGPKKGT